MASNTPLPVMFFIHGGNFDQGAGGVDIYHGGRLATANNVVVVTINYRLGVLGGLVAADGLIGGNFNLRDQRLALQWVQYNIAAFGGNRELVTIFGQSAGGASVAAHLASPPSWPLFHRAIPQSNPVSLPTETVDNALVIGDAIAVKLGCTTKTNPPPAAQVEQCMFVCVCLWTVPYVTSRVFLGLKLEFPCIAFLCITHPMCCLNCETTMCCVSLGLSSPCIAWLAA